MTFSTRARRACFLAYALLLFIGTHWPKLTIPGGGRPDLFVHAAIFALWAALLIASGFFGPPLSRRNIALAALVAVAYAAVDEALQAIPWVRRNAAWDDWALDCAGIALAAVVAFAIRPFVPHPRAPAAGLFP